MTTSRSYSQFENLTSMATTALGVIATVWGIGLAVLIVGAPLAMAVKLVLRLARMTANAF